MTSRGRPHLTVSQRASAVGWSPRDLRIVELLAQNIARAEVGEQLGCSVTTVDRRLAILRERLGVRTTIEVIVHAVRHGAI
jgi:DNA-binding CsgD family transcriptional regulator